MSFLESEQLPTAETDHESPCRECYSGPSASLEHSLGFAVGRKKHMTCVKALLAMGARVNGTDEQRMTPLGHACREGDLAMVRFLLSVGADINQPATRRGWPPLVTAAANGNADVIRALLEVGADAKGRCYEGWAALHHAVAGFDYEGPDGCGVRTLLALGIDPADHLTSRGLHPFTLALHASNRQFGGPESVMALLADSCRPVP